VETLAALEKPREVRLAINMLWASLGVDLLALVLDEFDHLQTLALVGLLSSFAILVVIGSLFYLISLGRNWARITFSVLFFLGLIPQLPLLVPLAIRQGFQSNARAFDRL